MIKKYFLYAILTLIAAVTVGMLTYRPTPKVAALNERDFQLIEVNLNNLKNNSPDASYISFEDGINTIIIYFGPNFNSADFNSYQKNYVTATARIAVPAYKLADKDLPFAQIGKSKEYPLTVEFEKLDGTSLNATLQGYTSELTYADYSPLNQKCAHTEKSGLCIGKIPAKIKLVVHFTGSIAQSL